MPIGFSSHWLPRCGIALLIGAVAPCASIAQTDTPRGSGPYPALMVEEPGLADHTVYRPQSLDKLGRRMRMPVVVWGNGGCGNAGNAARTFLTEIASHGYLVIASGPVRVLPAARATTAPPTAATPPATAAPPGAGGSARGPQSVGPAPGAPGTESLSRSSQLLDAIAWAQAQDQSRDSPYYGRLDTKKIAAMGTSCGGLQAIEVSLDPRVTTTVQWSSGTLDQPRAGANVSRADLPKLHGPILYVLGGNNDIATPYALKDFAVIDHVPVVMATNEGAGHGGTLSQPDGGAWAPLGVAWLDWQLKGDRKAAKMFTGERCGLCANAAWTVQRKQLR